MTSDLLLDRARELWKELAAKPVEFCAAPDGANVVVSPGSRLCPPLWTGIVVLGGASIITVPSVQVAQVMADASSKLFGEELVDADRRAMLRTCGSVWGGTRRAYLPE
ncbi:hypothetical protein ACIBJF_51465 [Streptomyces sp. NPDC050743]|uniref:hypothetical protein n=1 Tax=Streptomyces sp. NPDC050743 TaxID=3365634 RepID=UPI0037886C92